MKNDSTKDDRKLQIILAARALLAKEGEAGFSLREVASEVGIKLASLQYHFPTKTKLIDAILAYTIEAYVSELNELALSTDGDSKETLQSALKWLTGVETIEEDEAHLEVHLWSMALNDASVRRSLTEYHRFYISKVTELVANANPDISDVEARRRAVSIVSLQEGSLLFADGEAADLNRTEILGQIYLDSLKIAFG